MSAPPVVGGYHAPKPVWPTVIGVISVVFAAMGLLNGCGGLIMPLAMSPIAELMPDEGMKAMFRKLASYSPIGVSSGVLAIGVGVLLLLAGIRTIQWRRAGARLHVSAALLSFVHSAVACVYAFELQKLQFQAMQNAGGRPLPFPPELFGAIGLIIGMMFSSAYPTFLLIWFFRARIREQVSNWS